MFCVCFGVFRFLKRILKKRLIIKHQIYELILDTEGISVIFLRQFMFSFRLTAPRTDEEHIAIYSKYSKYRKLRNIANIEN